MAIGLDSLKYHNEFPEKVFAVDENGNFVNKMDASKTKLKNSQYWQRQYKKIGAITAFSAVALLVMLLFETNIIQMTWDLILVMIEGLL